MKTKLLLVALFIFSSQQIFSQAPGFQWAKAMGGPWADASYSIVLDKSGNIYTTGYFQGTADFDPGPGTYFYSALGTGLSNGFISKLDTGGNFVWAKAILGTVMNSMAECYSMALDTANNLYVTGIFYGTLDFDSGTNLHILSSSQVNMFVLKLDSLGNFIWVKQMGGSTGDIYGFSITIDAFGNILTTGQFQDGTVDFDPDSSASFNMGGGSCGDIFILKLNSNGDFIWAKEVGGQVCDGGKSIKSDDKGNVYVTGVFGGTVDFDPGVGVNYQTGHLNGLETSRDIFVLKLDSAGNFGWADIMYGHEYDEGASLTLDGLGNVYVTGCFSDTVDFDPGPGIFNLYGNDYDGFVCKLDNDGMFVWAKSFGGPGLIQPSSIVTNITDVYLTGIFWSTVDFDPGLGTDSIATTGHRDIFILNLDSSGNYKWAKSLGNINEDFGRSIILDKENNIYVTGDFMDSSMVLDSITLTSATGYQQIFIAKISNTTVSAIEGVEFKNGISIFPNPSSDHFIVSLSNHKKIQVTIADITGKIIYASMVKETPQLEISTKDFAEGVYTVQVKGEEFVETKKILITNQY